MGMQAIGMALPAFMRERGVPARIVIWYYTARTRR